jgi:predicted RNA-binding Zn-ribbon protein involved in translation (DUF1610 family)
MIEQTIEEWRTEIDTRFALRADVAFVCPACGHVATVRDHVEAGGKAEAAPQNCIGRTNGQGTKNGKDEGFGCNWAAYGLFGTMGKGRNVIFEDGAKHEVFDFAPKEEAG